MNLDYYRSLLRPEHWVEFLSRSGLSNVRGGISAEEQMSIESKMEVVANFIMEEHPADYDLHEKAGRNSDN